MDIVSYLMGKAAGGDGGGGSKTFLTSGWVNSYSSNTEITGNTVDFLTGSVAHKVLISPPAYVARDTKFPANSIIKIAVTVTAVSQRINFKTSSVKEIKSASGLFHAQNSSTYYAVANGNDVLTVEFSGSAVANVAFYPVNESGNEASDVDGTILVTGLGFNGELIFGSVTPPSA